MKMGFHFFSACSDSECLDKILVPTRHKNPTNYGNPNPQNFQILKIKKLGRFILIKIKYPDCKNYEGVKILLFENISKKQIISQREIDPHFCDSKNHISPIARFEPTKKGWEYAIKFCRLCN